MDYNDYLNMPADVKSTGIARFVPAAVVVSAFVGFVALAWYAYHSGSQTLTEEDLVVVEAEKTPIKDKPLDPGGMKFPNQDKTIFDNFGGNVQTPPRVERVMPQPEEPMPKTLDTSNTTTYVSDKLAQPAAPAAVEEAPKKEVVMEKETTKVGDLSYSKPPAAEAKPVKADTTPVKAEGDIKTYAAPAKVAEKPAHEAAHAPSGNAKIQLGAYKSEKEAQDGFAKIQKKFPELEGKKPLVVKADLGAKGIFYRLRVSGIGAAADAKSLCQKLSGKGQACLVAAE